MRLSHVGIEAPRPLEELASSVEVAALQLDEPLIDERFDEARAVFEGEIEAGVRRLEIAARERLGSGAVQVEGLARQL